jgi:Sulfotransferase family
MSSKNIFIHIPKTGGTTINCIMNKTEWQTKPDFNYRHIIYETKKSNSQDIFDPQNYDKYRNYNIFMVLRNPIDRIISEYYFIKDRQEFLSLIKPIPKNLKQYILSKQTNNYMTGFLVGKRMFDQDLVNDADLELVLNTIDKLNINVGIFEFYSKSLSLFTSITGIKWPKNIDIKRITLNRPSVDNVPKEINDLIRKNNSLDFKLYEYCLKKFEENSNTMHSEENYNFKGDKYNYVLKYTQRFNLLEIELKDKNFIHNNYQFFQDLNLYLHKQLRVKDGRNYVDLWNDCFISTIKKTYPNKPLSSRLSKLNDETEPLEKTKKICSLLNILLRGPSVRLYNKTLVFNKNLISLDLYDSNREVFPSNNIDFFSRLKTNMFK